MKIKLPLYVTLVLIIIILVLWFFPDKLKLISISNIDSFRDSLKNFSLLISIIVTLWLVLITQNISLISLNAQKAMNRPYIRCELLALDNHNQISEYVNSDIGILSPKGTQYKESNKGINILLQVSNASGGGKAIDIKIKSNFDVFDQDLSKIERNYNVELLPSGETFLLYIYNFTIPSKELSKLQLNALKIYYTTPFDESSKEKEKCLEFNETNQLSVSGSSVQEIQLLSGLSIKN